MRCISKCIDGELPRSRVHLARQYGELTHVSRVLEKYEIMRIQRYATRVFIFREQILRHENYGNVSVVRDFGE